MQAISAGTMFMIQARYVAPILGLLVLVSVCGCDKPATALARGSALPELAVDGWIHEAPTDTENKVLVITAFATW